MVAPDLAAEQVELVEPVSAEQVVPALVAVPVEPEPAVEQVEPELVAEPKPAVEQVEPEVEPAVLMLAVEQVEPELEVEPKPVAE